jgi:hypothetical protein
VSRFGARILSMKLGERIKRLVEKFEPPADDEPPF